LRRLIYVVDKMLIVMTKNSWAAPSSCVKEGKRGSAT